MSIEPPTSLRLSPAPLAMPAGHARVARVPMPLAALVGREAELATAAALLRDATVRLVTLTGPGGVGKTRLALQVAANLAADFIDGVAFVSLASIREPTLVAPVIAQALGIRRTSDQPALTTLKSVLRPRQLLLVLDNFEHVSEAAPALSELLQSCPRLTVLATSRALLHLSGEHNLPVPTLALPAETATDGLSVAELAKVEAVRLFVERSREVQPGFALTTQNSQAVTAICTRLDGLPLAIELAAARAMLFPPAALLARMERRLPMLTASTRDMPDRQRTMRDTIAWSYDLLTAREQAVFRCMSVFVDGCTLDAVEAVCAQAADDDEPAFVDIIDSLTKQSLLQTVASPEAGDGNGTTPRLTMLETVREFAAEQLAVSSDTGAARRHAAYYLDVVVRAEQTYWGDAPGNWRPTLTAEMGNLRAALNWAIANGETDMALRLVGALFDPHWIFDQLWLIGDSARAQRAWTQRALTMPGGSAGSRVTALVSAAYLAEARGDNAEAQSLMDEAMALARDHGDELGLATASFLRGRAAFNEGDLAAARRWLTSALAGFRAYNARGRAAWALCFLASLDSRDAIDEGGNAKDLERAAAHCEEALTTFRIVDYLPGIIRAQHGLAYIAYKQRDLEKALALTQEILTLAWADHRRVHNYLTDIADIAGRVGQPAIAARLYGAAHAERERRGESLQPVYRSEDDRDRAVASSALDEAAFREAWSEGRSAPLAQVVTEALAFALPPTQETGVSLTAREREVLPLLAEGKTDREIGEMLFLSRRTVENHVARLRAKLGAQTRVEAIEAARARGLLPRQSRDQ